MESGDGATQISPTLEETFYILSKKNAVYRVKLSEKGLCMQKEYNGNVKTETVSLTDIIGCRCMRNKRIDSKCAWHPISSKKSSVKSEDEAVDEGDISAYLYIYAYVIKKSKVKSNKKRERMIITLRFRSYDSYDENIKEAQKWRSTIRYLMESQMSSHYPTSYFATFDSKIENKMLVVLNPKSGVGKARESFHNKVVPLLTEADIHYDVHVTKHALDAKDLLRTQSLWQYMGGIVVVGGDGILHEVVNGLLERPDWALFASRLPFGIIPCGSGNGLAKSISHQFDEPHDKSPILVSGLNVARGFTTPMDLLRIEMASSVEFAFLSVGWGLVSDIDIESERLRALGSPRFTLWSVARLIGLRTYRAKLWYLPHERACDSPPTQEHSVVTTPTDEEDVLKRRESFYSVGSRKSAAFHSVVGSSYESLAEEGIKSFGPAGSLLPPLDTPISAEDSRWVFNDGEFVMVHAAVQSHLATDVFFAPSAQLADGSMWLCLIRAGISRQNLLKFLLGLSNGSHIDVPCIEMIRVAALRLEPVGGIVTIDGEHVDTGPLQAEVLPSALRVFARAH